MKNKQFRILKKIDKIYIPKREDFEDRDLYVFLKDIVSLTHNIFSFYYFSKSPLKKRRPLTEDEIIQYLHKLLDDVSQKYPRRMPSCLGINIPACCFSIFQLVAAIKEEQRNAQLLSEDIFAISQQVMTLNKIFFLTFCGENDIGQIIYAETLSTLKEKNRRGGLQKGKNTQEFKNKMYEEQKQWFYDRKAQRKTTYAVDFARKYYKQCKEEYEKDNTKKFPFHFTEGADRDDDNAFIYLTNRAQKNNRKLIEEYLKN